MSDGERAIFHYIAEVMCAKEESLIIIDEPENHLHRAILERLWNEIEAARPDCVYLYITHNLDFARSRVNSQIIWVKNMVNKENWNYVLLGENEFSDDLLLEVLGSRQNILFIEGTVDKSIDRKLYATLFPEYTIIPLKGCSSVIEATKAYNNLPMLHYKTIKGIVDRDRRSQEEIDSLLNDKIYVPGVAEVENLFLVPEVIEFVANKFGIENTEKVVEQARERTIKFLQEHLDEQALLFTKTKCQNKINSICSQTTQTIENYTESLESIATLAKPQEVYNDTKRELQNIIDNKDYLTALKVINNKGLLPFTGVTNEFGWKKQFYIEFVIKQLRGGDSSSKELCNILRKYIFID